MGRTAGSVTVAVPGNTVLPPGPYLLFVNRGTPKGEVPSVARQLFLGGPVPAGLATTREQAGRGLQTRPS